jgi:anaerobic selenocysteine-containing dehydrogenase
VEAVTPGACPLDCPDGCSCLVTGRDGKAVRLRGNPDLPFSRGALLAGRANVNAATEERGADLGGGAVYHDCSVWVRAAAGA